MKPCKLTLYQQLFNQKECQKWRDKVNQSHERLSNRHRMMFDSKDLSNELMERFGSMIQSSVYNHLTDELGDEWTFVGFNPRFRLTSYEPGDKFSLHEDGFFQKDWNHRTYATFMVYLNTVPQKNGGATVFPDYGLHVQPIEGLGVIFFVDNLMHYGEELLDGEKYLFRADLMYKLSRIHDPTKRQKMYDLTVSAEENPKIWDEYYSMKQDYKPKF